MRWSASAASSGARRHTSTSWRRRSAHAVATASQVTNVPITFGVLTTNTMAEAEVRSRGDGNKGREAALAAVQLANVQRQLLW